MKSSSSTRTPRTQSLLSGLPFWRHRIHTIGRSGRNDGISGIFQVDSASVTIDAAAAAVVADHVIITDVVVFAVWVTCVIIFVLVTGSRRRIQPTAAVHSSLTRSSFIRGRRSSLRLICVRADHDRFLCASCSLLEFEVVAADRGR